MKKSYCHVLPAIGGPIKVATPWNISNKPKALVNLSIPSRSTSTTDVKPTYTPVKYRLTNEMFAYKEAICFCFVFLLCPLYLFLLFFFYLFRLAFSFLLFLAEAMFSFWICILEGTTTDIRLYHIV